MATLPQHASVVRDACRTFLRTLLARSAQGFNALYVGVEENDGRRQGYRSA